MTTDEHMTESMENYLETILELEKEFKVARAKQISDKLNVQRGSVTGALKALSDKGLINYAPYSFITLTTKGNRIAREITERHRILKDFLLNVLQVDEDAAEKTACRMEHVVDPVTMERLMCFIDYIHNCPRAGDQWIESFINYCNCEKDDDACNACVETLLAEKKKDS
ncbi:MAG: metal-dependent transcriptional regulator [Desulfobacteraceae bacterium]|nr:metal-dependent transcriptional regulator [Desulfobacteraceae bacterium]